jgi:hypothetical protein
MACVGMTVGCSGRALKKMLDRAYPADRWFCFFMSKPQAFFDYQSHLSMSASRSGNNVASLASRCVHLKINPAPKTLRESREILKIVKGYGDVVMFRNLKVCDSFLPPGWLR